MNFIEIDGSQGEGGGQILRTAVSLACVLDKPIRVIKIRVGRKEPGLRPQHLMALNSAAQICNAVLNGAAIGSTEIQFAPGTPSSTISTKLDIGTAGSISLIVQTLIPIGAFRHIDLDIEITGGTEVPLSPTIDYLQRVALPAYRRIGLECSLPAFEKGLLSLGGGLVRLQVNGKATNPHSLRLDKEGPLNECTIVSASRNLPNHVAERQIGAAKMMLQGKLKSIKTEIDCQGTARSPGSSLLIYFVDDSKFIGADALGERKKRAEEVGREAASKFLSEIQTNSSVDSHLADMLPTVLCCVSGRSTYTTSSITEHLKTNLAIAKKLTNSNYKISDSQGKYTITIDGVAENSN